MPKTLKKKVVTTWTEEDLTRALDAIAAGQSIRSAAKENGMSEGVLRKRIKRKKAGLAMIGQGRQPTFDKDTEEQLATYHLVSKYKHFKL